MLPNVVRKSTGADSPLSRRVRTIVNPSRWGSFRSTINRSHGGTPEARNSPCLPSRGNLGGMTCFGQAAQEIVGCGNVVLDDQDFSWAPAVELVRKIVRPPSGGRFVVVSFNPQRR